MSTAARRANRVARSQPVGTKKGRVIVWVAGLTIVALFAVAVLMSRSEGDGPSSTVEQTATVSVEGAPLPAFSAQAEDAAVGMTVPAFAGQTFDGTDVKVESDGRPKVVLFLAHWCSHCQADVTALQAWIDANGMPEGVDLYAVSTWSDPAKPNYPASEWLDREGWTVTTVADDEDATLASAYGLTGTPMYVFADASGVVTSRYAGELPIPALEEAIDDLR